MGTVTVTIEIGDVAGERFEPLEVVVDTGSNFTCIPGRILRRLGVPVQRTAQAELADGRLVPVEIGQTVIRLQ